MMRKVSKQTVNCKKGGRNTCVLKEIVPIVLVPGIMGSYLRHKKQAGNIWDPDAASAGTGRKYAMARRFMSQRAKTAKLMLPTGDILVGENPEFANSVTTYIGRAKAAHAERVEQARKAWAAVQPRSTGRFGQVLPAPNPESVRLWKVYHDLVNRREFVHKQIVARAKAAREYGQGAGWDQVAADFYLDFLVACQSHDFANIASGHVWAIGYTWNYSNLQSAKLIDSGLEKIMSHYKRKYPKRKVKRCIIVTHSMGALVTRAALKKYPRVRKWAHLVVHAVAPNNGAPQAYRRMFTGFTHGSLALRSLLGPTARDVRTLVSALPSVFELMPNNRFDRDVKDVKKTWKTQGAPRKRPKKWLKWTAPAPLMVVPSLHTAVKAMMPKKFAKWYFTTRPARNVYAHYNSKIRPTGLRYWNVCPKVEMHAHRSFLATKNKYSQKRWLDKRYFQIWFKRGHKELKSPIHQFALERRLRSNILGAYKFHRMLDTGAEGIFMAPRFALIISNTLATEIAVEVKPQLTIATVMKPFNAKPKDWGWSIATYGIGAVEVTENTGDGTVALNSQMAASDRAEVVKQFSNVKHDEIMNKKAKEIVAFLDLYAIQSRAPKHKKKGELI